MCNFPVFYHSIVGCARLQNRKLKKMTGGGGMHVVHQLVVYQQYHAPNFDHNMSYHPLCGMSAVTLPTEIHPIFRIVQERR
jgi:hypothetical protein